MSVASNINGLAETTPVGVALGGTGASSLTDHGVLIGSGTAAVTPLAVAATGSTLMGVTGADPAFTGSPSFSGTVTAGTGLSVTTGDASVVAGNINLPTTASTTSGYLNINSVRWLHQAGNVRNAFLGSGSGNSTLTSLAHVGVGYQALQALTAAGNSNTAMGDSSCAALTSGSGNTGVGQASLLGIVTGSNNVAIGHTAGNALTLADSNNILIKHVGIAGDSGRIRIGTLGTQTTAFIAGIDGVNVGSVAKVLTMASEQVGTATITAGTGISVTPGANTITIANTSTGLTWTVITGATQALAVNNGYFANRGAGVTFTLPGTAAVGDVIEVSNMNAGGWIIAQNAGQSIKISSGDTTGGVGGSLASTANGDSVKMVCNVANTNFVCVSIVGNITVV